MSPLRGDEFSGRTVEEAIEIGLRQLDRKRNEVDIEVLERGKPSNMLGMGGEDARVLLSFMEDERDIEPEPVIDERDVPRRPDAVRAAAERRFERDEVEDDDSPPSFLPDLPAGAEVLRELLGKMGVAAEVAVNEERGSEGLEVTGEDLGILIGRGGENLVALQQIASAITSKKLGRSVHVPVDIEGYRHRREDQLREMAREVAERVRASGQAVTLEPMLSFERRIVHIAIKGHPGIRTESVGMDPNRRVVILSTAPGARGPVGPRPPFGNRPGYGPRPGFGQGPRPGFGGGQRDRY